LLSKIIAKIKAYPRQYWLMFFGMIISSIGGSMIWPFLMIYSSEKLGLPLAQVTVLMTINAFVGFLSALIAGPLIDQFGRKWLMVISLGLNGFAYLLLSQAETFPVFALLMGLSGAVNPLYRVGSDAMLADLIPKEKRVDAYALIRLSNNVGVALGPALGGFIATRSYTYAFLGATTGMVTYSLLLAFLAKETLPSKPVNGSVKPAHEPFGGYLAILRDIPFISFVVSFTLVISCAVMMWVLLGVYAKQNFGIPENQYGWLATTNAVMVILFQIPVTNRSKRYPNFSVLMVGAVFYSLAVTSIAFGRGFWWFWGSMVVMTLGELLLMPTSSAFVANLAPTEKRGRYMSIYGLYWGVAAGTAPLLGGFLNDTFGPQTIWFGGGVVGLIGLLGFVLLSLKQKNLKEV
jgi:MFS family permease